MNNEQKLVDICFQIGIMIHQHPSFKDKSIQETAEWIASQLDICGFKTVPCGSSWGVLKK